MDGSSSRSFTGDGVPVPVPNRLAVSGPLAGQQAGNRTGTLEQLRERLESGEPPEKKASRLSEEEQRLVQQAFQRNLFSMARQLPMKIRINGRGKHLCITPSSPHTDCHTPAPHRLRPGLGTILSCPPSHCLHCPRRVQNQRKATGGVCLLAERSYRLNAF